MVIPVRAAAWAALAVSGAALVIALLSEYVLGLVPCELCLWQRWPYRVVAALSLLALVLPRLARPLMVGALLATLAGAGLAATHVGVEQGWWPSPLPSCSAVPLGNGTIAERLARMPERPAKPCDAPVFLVPGLPVSMAAMNGLLALALATFLAISARQKQDKR